MSKSFDEQVEELSRDWEQNERWKGVQRDYSAEEVINLRGSMQVEYSLARNALGKAECKCLHPCYGCTYWRPGYPNGQGRA